MYLDFQEIQLTDIQALIQTNTEIINLYNNNNNYIQILFDTNTGKYKLYNYSVKPQHCIGDGEIQIENNQLLLTTYTTIDRKVNIKYYKSQNDGQYIKNTNIFDDRNNRTTYIATEHNQQDQQSSTQLEFNYLNNGNLNNVNNYIAKSKLEITVDSSANITNSIKEVNSKQTIEKLKKNNISTSNGFNFCTLYQETCTSLYGNCDNVKKFRFPDWYNNPTFKTETYRDQTGKNIIGNTYFTRLLLKDNFSYPKDKKLLKKISPYIEGILNTKSIVDPNKVINDYIKTKPKELLVEKMLQDLNLTKVKKDKKPNFAIVPFSCGGHIITLVIDLREPLPANTNRISSFDSSTYHYDQNDMKPRRDIFGGLSDSIDVLSTKWLQLSGCCGLVTEECCEEFNEIKDIIYIKDNFEQIQENIFQRIESIYSANTNNIYHNSFINYGAIKSKNQLQKGQQMFHFNKFNNTVKNNLLLLKTTNIEIDDNLFSKNLLCEQSEIEELNKQTYSKLKKNIILYQQTVLAYNTLNYFQVDNSQNIQQQNLQEIEDIKKKLKTQNDSFNRINTINLPLLQIKEINEIIKESQSEVIIKGKQQEQQAPQPQQSTIFSSQSQIKPEQENQDIKKSEIKEQEQESQLSSENKSSIPEQQAQQEEYQPVIPLSKSESLSCFSQAVVIQENNNVNIAVRSRSALTTTKEKQLSQQLQPQKKLWQNRHPSKLQQNEQEQSQQQSQSPSK